MDVIKTLEAKLEEIDRATEKLMPKLEALKQEREYIAGAIEALKKSSPTPEPKTKRVTHSTTTEKPSPKSPGKRRNFGDVEPWVIAALRQGAETLPEIKELFPKESDVPEPAIRNVLGRLVRTGVLTELEKGSGRKASRYGITSETHAGANGRIAA